MDDDASAERLRRGGYTRTSARFPSADGVSLAADLFLPAGASNPHDADERKS
jgi:predicted acyl esterase